MRARFTVALALVGLASSAGAQQVAKGLPSCTDPKALWLKSGDLFKVNCPFAVVLTPEAYAQLDAQREALAKLPAAIDENRKARDQVLSQYQQLEAELQKMNQVQDEYYAKLRERYDQLDRTAVESVENTRAALRLARVARFSSYLTSGAIGGAGGGLAGSRIGQGGGLEIGLGAAGGALLGVGINWALLKLLGVQ